MKRLAVVMALVATPAMAAGEYPFFSLRNTDLIVLLGFVVFVAVLHRFRVHQIIFGLLDKRAADIRAELDEARRLREEALGVLASFEKKQADARMQAERIVARAREDARTAASQTVRDMQDAMDRRVKAAQDQIASAEIAAVREVREKAAKLAIAAAGDIIAKSLSDGDADALIRASIQTVEQRLH